MSYEIVKGIKIEGGEVLIKSVSNNVFPKTFEWWKSNSLTQILEVEGRVGLDQELLLQYYEGNFQKSDNNYEKSVFFRDRTIIHWDSPLTDEEIKDELYEGFLKFKKRTFGSFIIEGIESGYFVCGKTKNTTRLSSNNGSAKIFRSEEDALYYMASADMTKYKVVKQEEGNK